MDQKEQEEKIQNSLWSKKILASSSREELLKLAENPDEFDYFISGVASQLNVFYVCYLWQYNDILREMMRKNYYRCDIDSSLNLKVSKVLSYLDEYASRDVTYRDDFSSQYEYLASRSIGIHKLDVTMNELDEHMYDMFQKIKCGDIDDVKTDKYYLATISYLSIYHPRYFNSCTVGHKVKMSLFDVDREQFDDHSSYRHFKRVADKALENMSKAYTDKKPKVKSLS